tara:strand:- start:634 stop:837 length:204 start_codon:yes stop_codon:yes gene_type:complete
MTKSASWYLERAKVVRREVREAPLREVLVSHIQEILDGNCETSLILDVAAVRENREYYLKKMEELNE